MAEKRVTYFVVLPFTRGNKGHMVADQPLELPTAEAAVRRARRIAEAGGAGLAFSRSGDPASGEWDDAVILAECGAVPEEAVAGVEAA